MSLSWRKTYSKRCRFTVGSAAYLSMLRRDKLRNWSCCASNDAVPRRTWRAVLDEIGRAVRAGARRAQKAFHFARLEAALRPRNAAQRSAGLCARSASIRVARPRPAPLSLASRPATVRGCSSTADSAKFPAARLSLSRDRPCRRRRAPPHRSPTRLCTLLQRNKQVSGSMPPKLCNI